METGMRPHTHVHLRFVGDKTCALYIYTACSPSFCSPSHLACLRRPVPSSVVIGCIG